MGDTSPGKVFGVLEAGRKLIGAMVPVCLCCVFIAEAHALGGPQYVTGTNLAGAIPLVQNRAATPLVVGAEDWPGVIRAVGDLAEDVQRVTAELPAVMHDPKGLHGADVVLIGTIGKSRIIDDLIRRHKLNVDGVAGKWETRSAMTVFPVTAASNTNSAADLEYRMYLYDEGNFTLQAVLAPTLNFVPGRGLRFAVSVDDGPRTLVDALEHNTQRDWETAVSDGVKKVTVPLSITKAGYHTLKIWAVDPGVVVERVVVSHGTMRPSYLGPPESFHTHTDPQQSTTVTNIVSERKEP